MLNQKIEENTKNANLSKNMQKHMLDFVAFLNDNDFFIEPEGENGWRIIDMDECVGHMNFAELGLWIDVCDFDGSEAASDFADDALKEFTWAHVRTCDHFHSDGKQCGCGSQPGFHKTILGKKYENLCFAALEFMSPNAKTLERIQELLLLYKQNKLKGK